MKEHYEYLITETLTNQEDSVVKKTANVILAINSLVFLSSQRKGRAKGRKSIHNSPQ